MLYQLTDLDIVFLSYDEPQADHFYNWLKNFAPREPLRVHGVKGFDSAHKAAANLCRTKRFITVDADNLVRKDFFQQYVCDDQIEDVVFSFKSRNEINGLEYGNGGIKIWPRDLVLKLDTHENSTEFKTDFCWTYRYYQVDFIGSDCQPNHTEFHAFRAGFREGVKMTLIRGIKLPTWKKTVEQIDQISWSRLLTWCSVGIDTKNGIYAILGARCALISLWIDELDPDLISDFDWFKKFWTNLEIENPFDLAQVYGKLIYQHLGIDIPILDENSSQWVKKICINPVRHGLL